MMKHTLRWCQTPPSVTVRIKPNTAHSLQLKRGLQLKRPNGQDAQGPPGKSQPRRHQDELYRAKLTLSPTLVIRRDEIAAFFRLFDDDLIQDFLWMDCCCKITDKYLLAMTFVYFRRARFSISEHNRMNFFIGLYLANTMEEDEEESKYEIFPWALGKSWRKHFPRFLQQRDKLWSRIEYRAAVSRRCCEEVIAIMPSHFVWQRDRAQHHSGAQRQYGERDRACVPRGPSASPAPCALCDHSTRLGRGVTPSPTSPLPFACSLSLETTPHRATVSCRKAGKTKGQAQAQHSLCCSAEEVPCSESACGSKYNSTMEWINEE
ncbi:speedy protein A [Polymixia lowei]